MAEERGGFRQRVQAGVMESPGESWYGPLVSRRISHHLARVLVRGTSVTADAVTGAMVLAGATGAVLFLAPAGWPWLLGAALLHLWLVLDAVDGEVARGRGQTSAAGIYLDAAGHYVVNPGLLWAMAMACHVWAPETRWIFGFIAVLAHVWSKAAGDVAAAARHHLAEDRGSQRYAGAGAAGPAGGRAGRGAGRDRSLVDRARLATDAATPVLFLTLIALLSVAGDRWPAGAAWSGVLAAAGVWGFSLAHAAKAAILFRLHYRTFQRGGPADPGAGAP